LISLIVWGVVVFLVFAFRFLQVGTNSAAVYVLRDPTGFRVATDVTFNEVDSVVFRLDATPLLNTLFETISAASEQPRMDVTFNEASGRGIVKQFHPDGSRLELSLARYEDPEAHPRGVVIGGDFPVGDVGTDENREGGGMALFDGNRWIHLWCSANEGIAVSGGGAVHEPHTWKYLSGRVVKTSSQEVIVESVHEVSLQGIPLRITRRLDMKAQDDFATLFMRVANQGDRQILYDYAYGDEPWVGQFGTSAGDVGWYEHGLVTREAHLTPRPADLIGFVDRGNSYAGETQDYSGYANFIQWLRPIPTEVYFSNSFYSVGARLLDSKDNRLLNIVWKNQYLGPGESKNYVLRVGFIRPGEDLFETARLLRKLPDDVKL